jgi:hypothetical protein
MSKIGVRIWRHVFESGDEKRIAQQHPDISMVDLQKDIPYIEDGERGHLPDRFRGERRTVRIDQGCLRTARKIPLICIKK